MLKKAKIDCKKNNQMLRTSGVLQSTSIVILNFKYEVVFEENSVID